MLHSLWSIQLLVTYNKQSHTRVLFIDYTSAFNTMQIHLLLERLLVLGVNRLIIHWIKNFRFSDYNKFASGGLNQILCFQIQEYLKDAFCHPYYFLYIQMRYNAECKIENFINMQRICVY